MWRRNMSGVWILGHLIWLSIEDMKSRQLSMIPILILGVTGVIRLFLTGEPMVWMPGTLLLLIGFATKESIGYGDGWLLLALGMWLSMERLVYMLGVGILCAVLYALLRGAKEVPLVPFLTAAYLTEGWI
jgi:leader peptidase (prepilin peptidase)/N-methyltransferase